MSDNVLDSVREAFEGKRGKILLVGGGIAIAGYVWWTRRNGTPQPIADPNQLVPSGGTGTRTPQSPPEVGNQVGGTPARKIESNAEWLSVGTDFLVGKGTGAAAAFSALNKALGGSPLTTQEAGWVSQVISAYQSPPDGMPPLNMSPPTPPTGTGNPTVKLVNVLAGYKIDQWIGDIRRQANPSFSYAKLLLYNPPPKFIPTRDINYGKSGSADNTFKRAMTIRIAL